MKSVAKKPNGKKKGVEVKKKAEKPLKVLNLENLVDAVGGDCSYPPPGSSCSMGSHGGWSDSAW